MYIFVVGLFVVLHIRYFRSITLCSSEGFFMILFRFCSIFDLFEFCSVWWFCYLSSSVACVLYSSPFIVCSMGPFVFTASAWLMDIDSKLWFLSLMSFMPTRNSAVPDSLLFISSLVELKTPVYVHSCQCQLQLLHRHFIFNANDVFFAQLVTPAPCRPWVRGTFASLRWFLRHHPTSSRCRLVHHNLRLAQSVVFSPSSVQHTKFSSSVNLFGPGHDLKLCTNNTVSVQFAYTSSSKSCRHLAVVHRWSLVNIRVRRSSSSVSSSGEPITVSVSLHVIRSTSVSYLPSYNSYC